MNDQKNQVWKEFQSVLRRRRMRRRAGQSVVLVGLLMTAVWWLASPPDGEPVVAAASGGVPQSVADHKNQQFMALYVPGDFCMRLEFVDVAMLDIDTNISFSLEPVIWQNCAW